MKEVKYNPFPLGDIPVNLQRSELHILRAKGYKWNDDREVVGIFEQKLADFWGSNYAVTTDSCTTAIEICFRYLLYTKKLNPGKIITVPSQTYVSAVQVLTKLGLRYNFEDIEWEGMYRYGDTPVWDCAVHWERGGFLGGDTLQCLSFQQKKRIPIGKMGAILVNDPEGQLYTSFHKTRK